MMNVGNRFETKKYQFEKEMKRLDSIKLKPVKVGVKKQCSDPSSQ